MKIIIAKSAEAINYIKPHLQDDPDYEPTDLVQMLKGSVGSENIFLALVIDGEELQAFLLAFAPPLQHHAFIYQAWAAPQFTEQHLKDSVFLRLLLWCGSKGITEGRAETTRSTKPFIRKWNFKNYSTIMTYTIPENFEEELLKGKHNVLVGSSESLSTLVGDAEPEPEAETTNNTPPTKVVLQKEEPANGRTKQPGNSINQPAGPTAAATTKPARQVAAQATAQGRTGDKLSTEPAFEPIPHRPA